MEPGGVEPPCRDSWQSASTMRSRWFESRPVDGHRQPSLGPARVSFSPHPLRRRGWTIPLSRYHDDPVGNHTVIAAFNYAASRAGAKPIRPTTSLLAFESFVRGFARFRTPRHATENLPLSGRYRSAPVVKEQRISIHGKAVPTNALCCRACHTRLGHAGFGPAAFSCHIPADI